MIYDKINNWQTYAAISDDIRLGLEYLKKMAPDVEPGVIELSPRVKAIVSEYTTKVVNENGYEAHRQYIDIQALLQGEERIACAPVERLRETKPYSEENDAAFYTADLPLQPSYLPLQPGYFAIFFPQDGHMPCLSVSEPQGVRKVVIKVKV